MVPFPVLRGAAAVAPFVVLAFQRNQFKIFKTDAKMFKNNSTVQ